MHMYEAHKDLWDMTDHKLSFRKIAVLGIEYPFK